MKYLAHAVIHGGKVCRRSIVAIENGRLSITPFICEIHSTVFISGIIMVVSERKITSEDRHNLDLIIKHESILEVAIEKVMHYASQHDIWANESDDVPVLLLLER